MRNITPLILTAIMLAIALFVFNAGSAFMTDGGPKVEINHLSASKMSDGSLTIYIQMENGKFIAFNKDSISSDDPVQAEGDEVEVFVNRQAPVSS